MICEREKIRRAKEEIKFFSAQVTKRKGWICEFPDCGNCSWKTSIFWRGLPSIGLVCLRNRCCRNQTS